MLTHYLLIFHLIISVPQSENFQYEKNFKEYKVYYSIIQQQDSITITGKLVDAKTKRPIFGINIYDPISRNGTVPNPKNNGIFSITYPMPLKKLTISGQGYPTKYLTLPE